MKDMENETRRFWAYLLEKQQKYLKKSEIRENYEEFRNLWKEKNNFKKVFDNLRKNKILFLIYKKWSVLSSEESLTIKRDKSLVNQIFFKRLFDYFDKNEIIAYFGLISAEHIGGNSWQTPHTFYIINTLHNFKKKVGNQTVIFVQFPKEIMIKSAILEKDKLNKTFFTDNEKTLLDKIYYVEYKKGKANLIISDYLNYEKIILYLGFFKNYPLVKARLITLLNETQLKNIR